MSTLIEKLHTTIRAIDDIKAAMRERNVDVDNTGLLDYGDLIRSISSKPDDDSLEVSQLFVRYIVKPLSKKRTLKDKTLADFIVNRHNNDMVKVIPRDFQHYDENIYTYQSFTADTHKEPYKEFVVVNNLPEHMPIYAVEINHFNPAIIEREKYVTRITKTTIGDAIIQARPLSAAVEIEEVVAE